MSLPVASIHTYHGKAEITFMRSEANGLKVTIDTERLHIRSVEAKEEDYDNYAALFGDQEVMCKYATGETKTREDIIERISNVWAQRWEHNEPYSGLAVFKKDSNEFIGHVILGHGDRPGESEIAYLFKKSHWGQGLGTEAVLAIVNEYAPATVLEGYNVENITLRRITATVRPDNLSSINILQKANMQKFGEEETYGFTRFQYSLDLRNLALKA